MESISNDGLIRNIEIAGFLKANGTKITEGKAF